MLTPVFYHCQRMYTLGNLTRLFYQLKGMFFVSFVKIIYMSEIMSKDKFIHHFMHIKRFLFFIGSVGFIINIHIV